MAITEKLNRLGRAARRLNEGSSELNRLIASIDKVLGQLMIGMDYVHPRPLSETMTIDREGKRVIELVFVGYLKVEGAFHLAAKTVKVLESKAQLASEAPGVVAPLLSCARVVRHGAVDLLPDLVSGLATQVDEVVNAMERRCRTAQALLDHLESVADESGPHDGEPIRGRRSTSPRFDDRHPG